MLGVNNTSQKKTTAQTKTYPKKKKQSVLQVSNVSWALAVESVKVPNGLQRELALKTKHYMGEFKRKENW